MLVEDTLCNYATFVDSVWSCRLWSYYLYMEFR